MFSRRVDPLADGVHGTSCRAIVDVGSNSIRMVAYGGNRRAPSTLFNEKVMAGLGSELAETGRIGPRAMRRGLEAVARFDALARQMGAGSIRFVATAAVRDAANGHDFVTAAEAIGCRIEVLSGAAEALASALGVASAFPGADGLVADLGGGSLELALLRGGEVADRVSLPMGVLRLRQLRDRGNGAIARQLAADLAGSGWSVDAVRGLPIYLVGGSWRTLARIDMAVTNYPLRVVHAYPIAPSRAARMVRTIEGLGADGLRGIAGVSGSRIPTLPEAAHLMAAMTKRFAPDRFILSASGLREGLLFAELDAATRSIDPLLAATEEMDRAESRFPSHGPALARWIAPLFGQEDEALARLRCAACNLGDVAWRANPDFRAERGLEIAIHGNWVGVDGAGREMLGQAIWSCFGGAGRAPGLGTLAGHDDMARATAWGLAMRLGQRFSGGTLAPLTSSRVELADGVLRLVLGPDNTALGGDVVRRRLQHLARALGAGEAVVMA